MQNYKTSLFPNLRRVAMVMGLAMFVIFAHKATKEVSSPNIAAGNRRQQTLAALSQGQASLSISGLTDQSAVQVMDRLENNGSRLLDPNHSGISESPKNTRADQPDHSRPGKAKDGIISDVVNYKKKSD